MGGINVNTTGIDLQSVYVRARAACDAWASGDANRVGRSMESLRQSLDDYGQKHRVNPRYVACSEIASAGPKPENLASPFVPDPRRVTNHVVTLPVAVSPGDIVPVPARYKKPRRKAR